MEFGEQVKKAKGLRKRSAKGNQKASFENFESLGEVEVSQPAAPTPAPRRAERSSGGATQSANTPRRVEYGDHYTRKDRKKILKPNVEHVTPEGYLYRTDSHGRIISVEGDLSPGVAKRNKYAQRKAGGPDRLPNDDGGHLIASIFKGSGDLDNLVPMNSNLNRGAYSSLENEWKRALDRVPPEQVKVKITPVYGGSSHRPIGFKVKHKIGDGRWKTTDLAN